MNRPSPKMLEKANEQVIYNLYMCLAHKTAPADGEPLRAIVQELQKAWQNEWEGDRYGNFERWKTKDIRRLTILANAIKRRPRLAEAVIGDQVTSEAGLAACTFTSPRGSVSVVFRATGNGEWIDNGQGLSGIPEQNTYITYGDSTANHRVVMADHATDQQVEALNWFYETADRNGWDESTDLTVSGYSKGGNKAQFVTIHTDIVKDCYSFCGQGFSPEAITAFQKMLGAAFDERRQKIMSFSSDNDYVNVLGQRLVKNEHIYYIESTQWDEPVRGYHRLESMLDASGSFHPLCEQGELSRYIEEVSKDLMVLEPRVRQHAVLGVMNVIQSFKGNAINGDRVSLSQTLVGIGISVGSALKTYFNNE